jgi:putative oxidoreductase
MNIFILRLFAGSLMLFLHGIDKFQNASIYAAQFPDPLGLGSALSLYLVIFAELLCSVLIITGTFVRLATIPLIITMSVAVFIVHAADPISKIELPILYLGIYLTLLVSGSGCYAFHPVKRIFQSPIANYFLGKPSK